MVLIRTTGKSIKNLSIDAVNRQLLKYFGYLVLYFAFIRGEFFYLTQLLKGDFPYQTSEWLINYGSGFVRRGLFGSLFLFVTPNQPWIHWLLFGFQFLLSAAIFIFFGLQLKKRAPNWFLTLLICSPAAICFTGWDSGAFGRKESIGYVVLIALALSFQNNRTRRAEILWLSSGIILFTLGIFTYEPIALLLPSVIYLIIKAPALSYTHQNRRPLITAFSAISLVGFSLSTIFHGSQKDVAAMCANLAANGLSDSRICRGGIYWIGVNLSSNIDQLLQCFPEYFIYLLFGLLAIAPYFFTRLVSTHKVYFFWAASFIAPLFLIAFDYGRWISIFVITTLIVLLAIDDIPEIKNRSIKNVAIAYVCLWGIPHSFPFGSRMPAVGLITTPMKYLAKLFGI